MSTQAQNEEVKRGTLADAIVAVTNEAMTKSAAIRVDGYVNSDGYVENVILKPITDYAEIARETLAWLATGAADTLKPTDVAQIAWDTAVGQTKESLDRYLRDGPSNRDSKQSYVQVAGSQHVKVSTNDPGTIKVGPFRKLSHTAVGAVKDPPKHRDDVTRSKYIIKNAAPVGAYVGDLVLTKGKFTGYSLDQPEAHA